MDTEPTFMEKTEVNILYISRALRLLFDLHKNYFWNYWEDIKEFLLITTFLKLVRVLSGEDMKKLYIKINEDPKHDKGE